MRIFLQFFVLIIGGLLVLSGCAAAEPSQVEQAISPTTVPEQMTEPEGETALIQATTAPEQVTESEGETAPIQAVATDGFIFYDSFADW